ncbi:Dabb family protein [Variovorax guangxiensis]|uniref:Dabb family protein n=1 Tax=Variovorax guangxiensis TaxID=1775474 RepID=A0A502DZ10_9BURK|nr:Dabb family protein [Variovorax guangxiensis]RZI69490.1 MAG: Dabb family protein [Variovorax sp.]TPG26629.1 Dabb family protein [Variovorax ginsengisoli]TPG30354.1 Dabb family protein [Variovorax guangxiensis]
MIKHIVMWKMVDPAEATRFKELLDTCKGIVPGMREFEVAVRAEGFEANHDVALYSVFDDAAALQSYIVHPHHKEVVATSPARASRSVFDYQT